jgi:hypothetical protein
MPVLRFFEIEEGFGRHPHAGKVDHGFYKASAASLRKRLTPPDVKVRCGASTCE